MRQTANGAAQAPNERVVPWAAPGTHPRIVSRAIVAEAKACKLLHPDFDARGGALLAKVIEQAIQTATDAAHDGMQHAVRTANDIYASLAAEGLRRCNACQRWCHVDTAIVRADLGVTYCDETCKRGAQCVHCQDNPATEDLEPYCSEGCKGKEAADRLEADECRREDSAVA